MSESLDRDVGRIESRLDAIERRLNLMEPEVKQISETLTQAKGGWRTLLLLGGAASILGSVLTQLAQAIGIFR